MAAERKRVTIVLQKDDEGYWLIFENPAGSCAVFMPAIIARVGPAVGRNLMRWADHIFATKEAGHGSV